MPLCPICAAPVQGKPCACGYDPSRDYARYPTLAPLKSTVSDAQEAYLRCPDCGGTAFRFRLKDRVHICLHCRRELVPDGPTPAAKIVTVALGEHHAVALHRDGTVRAVGNHSEGQCDVRDWKDITAIAIGLTFTIGLKKDGTVVTAGKLRGQKFRLDHWTGITAIAAGWNHAVGLRRDGTVIATDGAVRHWTDIRAIIADRNYTVGLRRDGTVAAAGNWFYNLGIADIVGNWTGITGLAADGLELIGLRADGTLCSSLSYHDYESWTDIRSIASGLDGFFAVRSDGTVLAVGKAPPADTEHDGRLLYKVTAHDVERYNRYNRVRTWTGIRTLYAGPDDAIGLKNDGTFLFTDSSREAHYRALLT